MNNKFNVLDTLQAFYLEWVNEYISVEKLADDKGLTYEQAMTLINYGREIHEARVHSDVKAAARAASLINLNSH